MPVGVTATSNATDLKDLTGALVTVSMSSQSAQITLQVTAEASIGGASQSTTRTFTSSFSTPLGASSEAMFETFAIPAIDFGLGQATIDLTPKFSLVGFARGNFASTGPCNIDKQSMQVNESGSQETILITINEEKEVKVFLESPSLTITQINLGVNIGASIRPIIGNTYSVDIGSLQFPLQSDVQLNGSPTSILLAEYLLPTPPPSTESGQSIDQWLIFGIVSLGIIVAVVLVVIAIRHRKKVATPKEADALPKESISKEQQVCPNCGAILPAGSKFCGKCGNPLQ